MTETKNVRWKSETLKSWVLSDRTGEHWQLTTGGNHLDIHSDHIEVLREYFRDERDQELGRWRWPEDPRYIVKPVSEHVVCVVNEDEFWERPHGRQGEPGQLRFRDVRDCVTDRPLGDSAARYKRAAWAFWQAHPELMPKPWHDAKPGEVWIVTDEAGEHPYLLDDSQFYDSSRDYAIDIMGTGITSARRIWPESKES